MLVNWCLFLMATHSVQGAVRFSMIDAQTNKEVKALCTTSARFTLIDFPKVPKSVGFVVRGLPVPVDVKITGSSPLKVSRTEKNAPVSFFGDKAGKITGRRGFKPGRYVLTAGSEQCVLRIFAGVKPYVWWIDGQKRSFKVRAGDTLVWDRLPATFNVESVGVGPVARVQNQRMKRDGKFVTEIRSSTPYSFFGRRGTQFIRRNLASFYDPFGNYEFRTTAYDSENKVLNVRKIPFSIRANGKWTQISNLGNRRHEGGFVQCGGDRLWHIGGRGTKVTDIYDVSTGKFSRGPTIENVHHFQPVCLNGVIYVVGAMTGRFPTEPPLQNVYLIDTKKNNPTFDKGPLIPAARRRGGAAAAVYGNCVYVCGGITSGHVSGTKNWFDSWCPNTNVWTSNLPQPQFARDHVQAAVHAGKYYVAGGRKSDYRTDVGYDDEVAPIEWYTFSTRKWARGAPLPKPRAAASVVAYFNMICVIGGESSLQSDAHNDVNAYNPRTNKWHSLAPIISERHATTAFVYQNKIWIMGGSGNRGGSPELTNLQTFTLEKN